MKPVKKLQLGKKGLTPEFMAQVKSFFETERMIKVDILKSACRNRDEAREIGKKIVEELGPKFGFKLLGYVLTIIQFRNEKKNNLQSAGE